MTATTYFNAPASNNSSLTPEYLTLLKRPFAKSDHEFLKEFVYLTEEAICNRIEEVDPAWTFELQRVERQANQCVVCARLTICGVSREGVGMQTINDKGVGEPEKGAATDALKRCARLFGIGRYLLDAPGKDQFDRWLANLQKGVTNAPTQPTQQPATVRGAGIPPTPEKPTDPIIPASWIDEDGAWKAFLKSANDKLALSEKSVLEALEFFASTKIEDWHTDRLWASAAIIAYAKDYDSPAIKDYIDTLPGKKEANFKLLQMAAQIAIAHFQSTEVT